MDEQLNSDGPQPKTFLDKFRDQCNLLGEKFGVNGKVVLIVIIICLVSVFIGYFDSIITNIVGIVYPVYWSMKALETKEQNDDKQWLTYWVVFALFILFESTLGFLLKYIPFYFFFKLAFLLWLFLPNFRGAEIVYYKFIRRFFIQYEKQIDESGRNFKDGFNANQSQKQNDFM